MQRDLTGSQQILLLTPVVTLATWLLYLQERLLGRDHFDLTRTHLEFAFAQAMEELLPKAPKQVVWLGLPELSTFEACSATEHKSPKEHECIW